MGCMGFWGEAFQYDNFCYSAKAVSGMLSPLQPLGTCAEIKYQSKSVRTVRAELVEAQKPVLYFTTGPLRLRC